jgi:signal transduction histidine kinase
MEGATKKAPVANPRSVLAGIPNTPSSRRLVQGVERVVGEKVVSVVSSLARLREALHEDQPQVILLDDRIPGIRGHIESVAEFSATAATILIARYERQVDVAHLIAHGNVEFVPRSGEWPLLAASLVERRLRWAKTCKPRIEAIEGRNIGELFRHEINNPLTGILGNAELILAHSDRLPAIDTQRIRTVVELAVRLRETVRRVSNAWEAQANSAKSA